MVLLTIRHMSEINTLGVNDVDFVFEIFNEKIFFVALLANELGFEFRVFLNSAIKTLYFFWYGNTMVIISASETRVIFETPITSINIPENLTILNLSQNTLTTLQIIVLLALCALFFFVFLVIFG